MTVVRVQVGDTRTLQRHHEIHYADRSMIHAIALANGDYLMTHITVYFRATEISTYIAHSRFDKIKYAVV